MSEPATLVVIKMIADGIIAYLAGKTVESASKRLFKDKQTKISQAIQTSLQAAIEKFERERQDKELTRPLLQENGPLNDRRVQEELAKLVDPTTKSELDLKLLSKLWKEEIRDNPSYNNRDFEKDAAQLIEYFSESLRYSESLQYMFDSYSQDKTAENTGILAEEARTQTKLLSEMWDAHHPKYRSHKNVRFLDDQERKFFVQRQALFEWVISQLLEQENDLPQLGLVGPGGFGKTTLALAVCDDEQVRSAYPSIFRLDLKAKPRLYEGGTKYLHDFSTIAEAAKWLTTTIDNEPGQKVLLLIDEGFDNEDPYLLATDDLKVLRTISNQCALIIATRQRELPKDFGLAEAEIISVDVMEPDEATELLSREIKDLDDILKGKLRDVAIKRFGRWPLLLTLANSAIRNRIADGELLAEVIGSIEQALDEEGLVAFDKDDAERADRRNKAVRATLEVSLRLLKSEKDALKGFVGTREHYSQLAIFPIGVAIPLKILERLWQSNRATMNNIKKFCSRLRDLSLIQSSSLQSEPAYIRLHDVIHVYLVSTEQNSLPDLHERLLNSFRKQGASQSLWIDLPLEEPYLWDHLPHHLRGAGRRDELVDLLRNPRYLARKCLARSAPAVERDLALPEAQEAYPDEVIRQGLQRTFAQMNTLVAEAKKITDCRQHFAVTLLSRLILMPELAGTLQAWLSSLEISFLEPLLPFPDLPHPAQERDIAFGGGTIGRVFFNADGTHIAAVVIPSNDQGRIIIWDVVEGTELSSTPIHTIGTNVPLWTISADFSTYALVEEDGKTIHIGFIGREQEPQTVVHQNQVLGCAFDASGTRLLSYDASGEICLWTASEERRVDAPPRCRILDGLFCGDGTPLILYADTDNRSLIVWNVEQNTTTAYQSDTDEQQLRLARISDNRKTVVAAASLSAGEAARNEVLVWQQPTPPEQPGNDIANVADCSVSADGALALFATQDVRLYAWPVNTRTLASLNLLEAADYCAINSKGNHAITVSEKRLLLWSLALIQGEAGVQLGEQKRCAMAGNSLGSWIDSDAVEDQELQKWEEGLEGLSGRFVTASLDGAVRVWDIQSAQIWQPSTKYRIQPCCAISVDGRFVVFGDKEAPGRLSVYDIGTGLLIADPYQNQQKPPITACVISADGSFIVAAFQTGVIDCIDLGTGSLTTITDPSEAVLDCVLSPDSSFIVATYEDKILRIWDRSTGKLRGELHGHTGPVNRCVVSADGVCIVSASDDRTIRVWDAQESKQIMVLKGHIGPVYGCTITVDKHWIASVSDDCSVRVWNTTTWELATMLHVEGPLADCAWFPDNERLLVVGKHGAYFLRLLAARMTKDLSGTDKT